MCIRDRACPTLTSEPTLFRRAIDVDIHVRIPTEPTAAIASLPILPTQAMSVRDVYKRQRLQGQLRDFV